MLLQLKESRLILKQLVFLLLLIFPLVTWADSFSPLEVIQSGTDKMLIIIHQSKTGQAPELRREEDEIFKIVSSYFNFDEMSKRSLGDFWDQQPPEKRKFAELFRRLLFNTYVDQIENYQNEKSITIPKRSKMTLLLSGPGLCIRPKISRSTTGYTMRGGGWKVYDVVVNGSSYVHNYRIQFDRSWANSLLTHCSECFARKSRLPVRVLERNGESVQGFSAAFMILRSVLKLKCRSFEYASLLNRSEMF